MNSTLIYLKEGEHLTLVMTCSGCHTTDRDSAPYGDSSRSLEVYTRGTVFALEHRACLSPKVVPILRAIPSPGLRQDRQRFEVDVGDALLRIDRIFKAGGDIDYCKIAEHARTAFINALKLCPTSYR